MLMASCLGILIAAAAPAPARLHFKGGSPLSAAGVPLFPSLAGSPMPGWLKALDREERGRAYEGYMQHEAMPPGQTLALLRTHGLLGAYVVERNRCIGEAMGEPLKLESFEDAERQLVRGGFRRSSRFIAMRAGDFAVDGLQYERTRQGYVERYVFGMALPRPAEGPAPRPFLCESAYFPVATRGAIDALRAEMEDGLARVFRSELAFRPGERDKSMLNIFTM